MMALLVAIALLMWRGLDRKYVITLWVLGVVLLVAEFLPHLNGPKLSF